MYLLNLSYTKEMNKIEPHIDAHMDYVNKYFASGHFVFSGRKNPRSGGIILCDCKDKDEIDLIVKEDPFIIEDVAEYEVIDFIPTRCQAGLEKLLEK